MKCIRTYSAEETVQTGRALGKILQRGDVVCLAGDLGAGKTAFTGGIASAMGIQGYVTSPTFTIVNEYRGSSIPLYHFDVYRISDPEEMFEIGFEEYVDGDGVVVIEWAELIKDILPGEHIWVEIRKDRKKGDNSRVIDIQFRGDKYLDYERIIERADCFEDSCS